MKTAVHFWEPPTGCFLPALGTHADPEGHWADNNQSYPRTCGEYDAPSPLLTVELVEECTLNRTEATRRVNAKTHTHASLRGTRSKIVCGMFSKIVCGTFSKIVCVTFSKTFRGTLSKIVCGTFSKIFRGTLSKIVCGTFSTIVCGAERSAKQSSERSPLRSLRCRLTPCADEEHKHGVAIGVEFLYPRLPVLVRCAPVQPTVHVALGPHEALSTCPRGAGERQHRRHEGGGAPVGDGVRFASVHFFTLYLVRAIIFVRLLVFR